MYRRIVWSSIIISIFFLPFASQHLYKTESNLLYCLLFVALLGFGISAKGYIKENRFIFPIAVWLTTVILASLFPRVSLSISLNNAAYYIFYALVFIIIGGFDEAKKKQIALALIAGSFFISIRALVQQFVYIDKVLPYIFTKHPPLTSKEFLYILDIIANKRAVSIFNSPNIFASYLVLVNLLIFGYLLAERSNISTFFIMFVSLAMNTLCLWLTRSFSGMTSFIFGVFTFFVLLYAKDRKEAKKLRYQFLVLASTLSVLFLMLAIHRYLYEKGPYNLLNALQGRALFWQAALRVIRAKPFSFTGPGNYPSIYYVYKISAYVTSGMAHNLLLQLWVELGPCGLTAFAWFMATLFFYSIKNIFRIGAAEKEVLHRMGVISATLAFLFQNMFDFGFFIPHVAIIWWILCALAL